MIRRLVALICGPPRFRDISKVMQRSSNSRVSKRRALRRSAVLFFGVFIGGVCPGISLLPLAAVRAQVTSEDTTRPYVLNSADAKAINVRRPPDWQPHIRMGDHFAIDAHGFIHIPTMAPIGPGHSLMATEDIELRACEEKKSCSRR
jgi:hypothetical protein